MVTVDCIIIRDNRRYWRMEWTYIAKFQQFQNWTLKVSTMMLRLNKSLPWSLVQSFEHQDQVMRSQCLQCMHLHWWWRFSGHWKKLGTYVYMHDSYRTSSSTQRAWYGYVNFTDGTRWQFEYVTCVVCFICRYVNILLGDMFTFTAYRHVIQVPDEAVPAEAPAPASIKRRSLHREWQDSWVHNARCVWNNSIYSRTVDNSISLNIRHGCSKIRQHSRRADTFLNQYTRHK